MTTRPTWLQDAALGLVVTAFGLWEAFARAGYTWGASNGHADRIVIALAFGVAVGLHRLAPGAALSVVWLACIFQVLSRTDIMYVELAATIVAFGAARWGSTAVVWLSALSIPLGAVLAVAWVLGHGTAFGDILFDQVFRASRLTGIDIGPGLLGFIGLLILALPWLAGMVFRVREQAVRSREQERVAVASKEQAEEIAALRAEQTRMAHDVHDVVGHSLAVILAQAESAQFLPDDDPDKMKTTMANIATSARQSLRDVRQVLSATETQPTQDGGLDKLIEGVRAAGNEVRSTVIGTPRPLPPEIDAVAYRTLQEMLTNAIKHGVRGETVTVMRHWAEELTIAVQNPATAAPGEGGLGLAGMRLRLESVGGRLDVRRDEGSFTATAWLPLRHGMLAP
jgi:signal transduction histidine kinase